ncbi:MAG: hypothetical protein JW751_29470 [Polyangiaceae bacterium]|nr:hypothetical protein [Polyangiaceae bacterium]
MDWRIGGDEKGQKMDSTFDRLGRSLWIFLVAGTVALGATGCKKEHGGEGTTGGTANGGAGTEGGGRHLGGRTTGGGDQGGEAAGGWYLGGSAQGGADDGGSDTGGEHQGGSRSGGTGGGGTGGGGDGATGGTGGHTGGGHTGGGHTGGTGGLSGGIGGLGGLAGNDGGSAGSPGGVSGEAGAGGATAGASGASNGGGGADGGEGGSTGHHSPECQECVTTFCDYEIDNRDTLCAPGGTADCQPYLSCLEATGCSEEPGAFTDWTCYCGGVEADSCIGLDATLDSALGPCKEETQTLAGTTTPLLIGSRLTAIDHPLGAVNQVFMCRETYCIEACGLPPPDPYLACLGLNPESPQVCDDCGLYPTGPTCQ